MTRPPEGGDAHAREARFHDEWARGQDLDAVKVREAFESPVALENRFVLDRLGPLRGLRLLDLGAGLGESSVYFALQGAEVTTLDISPAMVAAAEELAARHGVRLTGVVAAGEEFPVPAGAFDVVYAANLLHHIEDRDAFFRQVHRALRPGGRFFTIDPLKYNPVIEVYRRLATKVRTEDERPLGAADLARARRYFPDVGHREFWLLTLSLFLKYFLLDRVDPNQERYWKRIFHESEASLWWWRPLAAVDAALTRLPLVGYLGWNIVMWGTRP
jgi:SAM-dependent methyltransferase